MTETAAPPLVPQDECDRLEQRVQHAIAGFVEAPRASVEEADRLLEEITARFTDAVAERRRHLRESWQASEERHGATVAPTHADRTTAPEHPDDTAPGQTAEATPARTEAPEDSGGAFPGERPRSERDLHGEVRNEKGRQLSPAAAGEGSAPAHEGTHKREGAPAHEGLPPDSRLPDGSPARDDAFTRAGSAGTGPTSTAADARGAGGDGGAPAGTADTEQLRLALRDYRELAERLLHV